MFAAYGLILFADQRGGAPPGLRPCTSQPPNRPASIRTRGVFAPPQVPFGVPDLNGCCHLGAELSRLFPDRWFRRDLAVARTRRFATNSIPLGGGRALPGLLLRSGSYTSPVTHSDAARSLASAPPPRSPASSHSCRPVRPALSPNASDPCPALYPECNALPAPASSADTYRLPS